MTRSNRRADELEVGQALQFLVGKTFSDWGHPLFAVFHFGEMTEELNSHGRQLRYGEFTVSGDDGWRITHGSTTILGSEDHAGKYRFYRRKTPPRDEHLRLRWQRAHDFFDMFDNPSPENPLPSVTGVELSAQCDLTIRMTDGYELFFCTLTSQPHTEIWTFGDHVQTYWYRSDGYFDLYFDGANDPQV
jgi:hypothetical protein